MKIAVISDTHIPDKAGQIPQAVIDAFKGVDMIVHAGDLVSLAALEQLKLICNNVHAVFGNMDPYEVRSKLPEKEVISVGKFKIGLMHGYGPPQGLVELAKRIFAFDKVDLVIFGHSHQAFCEKRDNILFFNPGSATDKIFAPYNSYGIIEINDEIAAKIVKF